MFDFVRKHQRVFYMGLLPLIGAAFVFVGPWDNFTAKNQADVLVKIGKQEITQQMFKQKYQEMLPQLVQQPDMTEAKAKEIAFLQVVADTLNTQYAQEQYLTVSDADLRKYIQAQPEFQTNGNFDFAKYKQLLAAQNISEKDYEQKQRERIMQEILPTALRNTAIVPKAILSRLSLITEQSREVQEINLPIGDFLNQVKISDKDVETAYQSAIKDPKNKNSPVYFNPENVSFDYVVLDIDNMLKNVKVTDDKLAAGYEKYKAQHEQRVIRHILIQSPESDTPEKRLQAKAKAENLLVELKGNPKKFAEIASKNSEDETSNKQGGLMPAQTRVEMETNLANAVFVLKSQELSGVVESKFGYHIALLESIDQSKVKPLAEAKAEILKLSGNLPEITAELAKTKGAFDTAVFKNAQNIQEIAKTFSLTVQSEKNFSGKNNEDIFADENFKKSIFSKELRDKKQVSPVIRLANGSLAVIKINAYTPTQAKPLNDLKEKLRVNLTNEAAIKLAKTEAEKRIVAFKAGTQKPEKLGDNKTVSVQQRGNLSNPALKAVLTVESTKLPTWVSVEDKDKGYVIYQVNKINVPKPNENDPKIKQEELMYSFYLGEISLANIQQNWMAQQKINMPKFKSNPEE